MEIRNRVAGSNEPAQRRLREAGRLPFDARTGHQERVQLLATVMNASWRALPIKTQRAPIFCSLEGIIASR